MQYSSGKKSPRDFPSCESRLIVACLMTASGRLHKRSLHLIALQLIPCTLFNMEVRTFFATKFFAAGSSTDPCHLACVSKSVPRDVISSIGCSTQLPRSSVGVTHVSRGWLLKYLSCSHLDLQGSWGVLLMMRSQSWVCLQRRLKVLFAGLLK
jgi:hypothetical protein